MTHFLVRIELHEQPNLKHPDYQKLHDAMKREGFVKQVVGSSDGKTYQLLTAEYLMKGNYTLEYVHNKAKAVADSVDAKNGVIATISDNLLFSGLRLA